MSKLSEIAAPIPLRSHAIQIHGEETENKPVSKTDKDASTLGSTPRSSQQKLAVVLDPVQVIDMQLTPRIVISQLESDDPAEVNKAIEHCISIAQYNQAQLSQKARYTQLLIHSALTFVDSTKYPAVNDAIRAFEDIFSMTRSSPSPTPSPSSSPPTPASPPALQLAHADAAVAELSMLSDLRRAMFTLASMETEPSAVPLLTLPLRIHDPSAAVDTFRPSAAAIDPSIARCFVGQPNANACHLFEQHGAGVPGAFLLPMAPSRRRRSPLDPPARTDTSEAPQHIVCTAKPGPLVLGRRANDAPGIIRNLDPSTLDTCAVFEQEPGTPPDDVSGLPRPKPRRPHQHHHHQRRQRQQQEALQAQYGGYERLLGEHLVALVPAQEHAFACIDFVDQHYEMRFFDISQQQQQAACTEPKLVFRAVLCMPLTLGKNIMVQVSLADFQVQKNQGVAWPVNILINPKASKSQSGNGNGKGSSGSSDNGKGSSENESRELTDSDMLFLLPNGTVTTSTGSLMSSIAPGEHVKGISTTGKRGGIVVHTTAGVISMNKDTTAFEHLRGYPTPHALEHVALYGRQNAVVGVTRSGALVLRHVRVCEGLWSPVVPVIIDRQSPDSLSCRPARPLLLRLHGTATAEVTNVHVTDTHATVTVRVAAEHEAMAMQHLTLTGSAVEAVAIDKEQGPPAMTSTGADGDGNANSGGGDDAASKAGGQTGLAGKGKRRKQKASGPRVTLVIKARLGAVHEFGKPGSISGRAGPAMAAMMQGEQPTISLASKEDALALVHHVSAPVRDMHTEEVTADSPFTQGSNLKSSEIGMSGKQLCSSAACFSWSWLITDEGNLSFGVSRVAESSIASIVFAAEPPAANFSHPLQCALVTARIVFFAGWHYFEVIVMPPPPSVKDDPSYEGSGRMCETTASYRMRLPKIEGTERLYVRLKAKARAKPVACPIGPHSPFHLKHVSGEAPAEVALAKTRAVDVVSGSRHALVLTSSGAVLSVGNNAFGQCGRSTAHRGLRVRRGVCDREGHQMYPDEMKHVCTSCGRWGEDAASETSEECALTPGRRRAKVATTSCVRCYRCADCVDKKRLLTDTLLDTLDAYVALGAIELPFARCVQVAAGRFHSVFLSQDGDVYTCGLNNGNQLGRELAFEPAQEGFGQHVPCLPHTSATLAKVTLPDAASSPVLRVRACGDLSLLLTKSGHAVVCGGFLPSKCIDLQATLGVSLYLNNARPGQRHTAPGDSQLEVFVRSDKQVVAFAHTEWLQDAQEKTRVIGGVCTDYVCLLRQTSPRLKPNVWEYVRVFKSELASLQKPSSCTITFDDDFEPVGFVPELPVVFGWTKSSPDAHTSSSSSSSSNATASTARTKHALQFRLMHDAPLMEQTILSANKQDPLLAKTIANITQLLHNPFFTSGEAERLRRDLLPSLRQSARSAAYACGMHIKRSAHALTAVGMRPEDHMPEFDLATITIVVNTACLVRFALKDAEVSSNSFGDTPRRRHLLAPNTPCTVTIRRKGHSPCQSAFDCETVLPAVVARLESTSRFVCGLLRIDITELSPLEHALLPLEFSLFCTSSAVAGAYDAATALRTHLAAAAAGSSTDTTPQGHMTNAIIAQTQLAAIAVNISLLSREEQPVRQGALHPDLPGLLSRCLMQVAELKVSAQGADLQQWQRAFHQLMDIVVILTDRNSLLKRALEQFARLDARESFTLADVAQAEVVAFTLNRCWEHVSSEDLFSVLGISTLGTVDDADKLVCLFQSFFDFTKKTGASARTQFFLLIRSCLQAMVQWTGDHADKKGAAVFLTELLDLLLDELTAIKAGGNAANEMELLSSLSSLLRVCSKWVNNLGSSSKAPIERLLRSLIGIYTVVAGTNRDALAQQPSPSQQADVYGSEAFGHVCTVESAHPYTHGLVEVKHVSFKKPCMVAIGFHSSCSLASPEDRLSIVAETEAGDKTVTVTGSDTFPEAFQVTPATRVTFRLETTTREGGSAEDDSAAFGYRCQVVAFPITALDKTVDSPTRDTIETQLADVTIKLCKRVLGDVTSDKDEAQVAQVALTFNPTFHGQAVKIEDRAAATKAGRVPGQIAERPEGHNRACCFSLFPIALKDERKEFAVEVMESDAAKAGGMAMGFVVMPKMEDEYEKPPLQRLFKSIPSSAILINENSLVYVANSEAYKGNNNLGTVSKESNFLHLNTVTAGEKIKMWANKEGELFIQGPSQKDPAKIPLPAKVDIEQDLYAFVDVYGRTQRVKMTGTSEVRLEHDPAYPRSAPCPFCKAAMVMTRGYADVTCEYGQQIPFGARYMLCPKCLTTSSLSGAFAMQRKVNTGLVEKLVPIANMAFTKLRPGVFALDTTFDRGLLTWELQVLSHRVCALGVQTPTQAALKKPLGVFIDCKADVLQYGKATLMPWPPTERTPRSFMFVLDCSSGVLTVAERNGPTKTLQVAPGSQPCVCLDDDNGSGAGIHDSNAADNAEDGSTSDAFAITDHVRIATLAWSYGAEDVLEASKFLPLRDVPVYAKQKMYARMYDESEVLSASAECNTACLVNLFSHTMQARLLAHAQAPSSLHGLVVEVHLAHVTAKDGVMRYDPTCDASVIVPGRLASEDQDSTAVYVDVPVVNTENQLVTLDSLAPLRVFPVGTAAAHGRSVSFVNFPRLGSFGWPEYLALTQQSPLLPWMVPSDAPPQDLVSLQIRIGLELSSFTCLVPRELVRRYATTASEATPALHRLVEDAAFVLGHVQLSRIGQKSAEELSRLASVTSELLRFEPALASHSLSALQHPLEAEPFSALELMGAGVSTSPSRQLSSSVGLLRTPSSSDAPPSPRRAGLRRFSSVETPVPATAATGAPAGSALGIARSVKDMLEFFEEVQVLVARVREGASTEDWQRAFGDTEDAAMSPWTSIGVLNFLARTTTRVDVLASVLSAFSSLFATRSTATTYYDEDDAETPAAEDGGVGEEEKGSGSSKGDQANKADARKQQDGKDGEDKDNKQHQGNRDKKGKKQGDGGGGDDDDDGEGDKPKNADGRGTEDSQAGVTAKRRKLNLLEESVNAIHTLDLGHGLELRASRTALIQFLSMVAHMGTSLPPAHPLQRLAIRCWALPRVAEGEPQLLQGTHVLSWLSKLLLMEERSSPSAAPSPRRGTTTISRTRTSSAVADVGGGAGKQGGAETAGGNDEPLAEVTADKKENEDEAHVRGEEGQEGKVEELKEDEVEEDETTAKGKGPDGSRGDGGDGGDGGDSGGDSSKATTTATSTNATARTSVSVSHANAGDVNTEAEAEEDADGAIFGEDEIDVTPHAKVSVSSQPDMAGSLVDGRTDTMWQAQGGFSVNWIKLTLDPAVLREKVGPNVGPPKAVYVHVDPTRDPRDRIPTAIELQDLTSSGMDKPVSVPVPSASKRPMWLMLECPAQSSGKLDAVVELKLVLKSRSEVRVRQVRVCCGAGSRALSNEATMGHPIHCDALVLFKLLSAGLLKSDAQTLIGRGGAGDEELLGLLNRDTALNTGPLQTQMLKHIVRGLKVETAAVVEACCSSPAEHSGSDTDTQQEEALELESREEYVLELLDLLRDALSRSASAVPSMAVLKLLYQLVHCASTRVQSAAVNLLRVIAPRQKYPSLPKVDVVSFAGTAIAVSHVRMLLAAVAKIIQVQLRFRLSEEGGGLTSTTQQLSLKQLCGVEEHCLPSQTASLGLSRQASIDPTAATAKTTDNADADTHLVEAARRIKQQVSSWQVAGDCAGAFKDIVGLVSFLLRTSAWQKEVKDELASLLLDLNHRARTVEGEVESMFGLFGDYSTWLAAAALAVLTKTTVGGINKTIRQLEGNTFLCQHHDDGVTAAAVFCHTCHAHYCTYCDKFAHLHPSKRNHERKDIDQIETLSVEWNDGYTRIKQPSFLILVDPVNLRSIVEFRPTKKFVDGTARQCRFCLAPVDGAEGKSADRVVCASAECVEALANVCQRTLPCGHACQGLRDEPTCPPCLQCAKAAGLIQQDADDECMVCFCGCLREGPCIMLGCGHIFHADCIFRMLKTGWPGPRITFDFATCPLCRSSLLEGEPHPLLATMLAPIKALHADVRRKALMRLQYDNEKVEGTEEKRAARAMKKYTYYKCFKCSKAYFGGEEACAVGSNDFDEEELVCPACSGGEAQQVCPKHGTDFLEYKCRYCCSVAVFFCFGTTHFCQPCHDDYQRCLDCPKANLPKCPAGPKLTQLEGEECPLHVKHPPTGEEFALGCGICRNAQTF
ncbi:highwire [Salpingoeca rosetta]|uniref:Highwire n=1 Tax=Salpingoeca rosetta (strain ATCC 50818 / BSB-021) TaxID=946362 RepID=F2U2L8_SALR5|nr:highwire [Salpingoeca rosetta]EGD81373.1 highwire [Salpingoeca rosetta]|eukprot:XP_004996577.1 highwire [Salpingoeca rosetta]